MDRNEIAGTSVNATGETRAGAARQRGRRQKRGPLQAAPAAATAATAGQRRRLRHCLSPQPRRNGEQPQRVEDGRRCRRGGVPPSLLPGRRSGCHPHPAGWPTVRQGGRGTSGRPLLPSWAVEVTPASRVAVAGAAMARKMLTTPTQDGATSSCFRVMVATTCAGRWTLR
ncbi:hypothetical protein I4F81_000953 [Pyropia yezoensis]|uniref:Uncharacterized protein n=1 Tax=Pyropia yezoensis TaxID=2788 RepID=A0ACC3BK61_PYRYE|nr:hypothetical protein I4F81_000953 [Neopyropia yezoensis]